MGKISKSCLLKAHIACVQIQLLTARSHFLRLSPTNLKNSKLPQIGTLVRLAFLGFFVVDNLCLDLVDFVDNVGGGGQDNRSHQQNRMDQIVEKGQLEGKIGQWAMSRPTDQNDDVEKGLEKAQMTFFWCCPRCFCSDSCCCCCRCS